MNKQKHKKINVIKSSYELAKKAKNQFYKRSRNLDHSLSVGQFT